MEALQDAKRRKRKSPSAGCIWLTHMAQSVTISSSLQQSGITSLIYFGISSTDLDVKISTNEWTTDKISYEQGLFQGCPLSVVLFLMVFQICLDQLRKHSNRGYNVSTGSPHNQRAYEDNLIFIAKNKTSAQMMFTTVEHFLRWSATLRAKPAKWPKVTSGHEWSSAVFRQ